MENLNGEHLVTLCKWNILETHIVYVPYSELARNLFLVSIESTNKIKIKISNYKFIGYGCIRDGISLMNACWVSHALSALSSFK